jgi:hypothetical protein
MSEAIPGSLYQVLPKPLTDEFKAKHARAWTEIAQPIIGNPLRNTLILIGSFSAFGFCLSLFLPPSWRVLLPGCMALGGAVAAWIAYSWSKQAKALLDERLHTLQSASEAQLHTVDLSGPHRFVTHEHGVILLVPAGPQQTFFYSVSNCTDDPVEDEVYAALERKQVPSRWSWSEIPGVPGPHSFEMQGPPIVPRMHPEFDSPDEWGDFVESLGEEFHGGGHILSRDFNALLEPAQQPACGSN